jgi:hypothetical protein
MPSSFGSLNADWGVAKRAGAMGLLNQPFVRNLALFLVRTARARRHYNVLGGVF